ncbi:MAG: polysaccharide deacetylase family protein [Bacteroidetes bacterium]|nr:polysaccharide deacetylase family protein [Bacteroidota bacterium]
MYFVKAPFWLRSLYRSLVWKIPEKEKILYLTFDDGPHETATPFVLDELKRYGASATFFCIGKNVDEHSSIYQRILEEGHRVGNHTQNHLNGWKVSEEDYLNNIDQAAKTIHSNLFRPPYGRIKKGAINKVKDLIEKNAKERGIFSQAKIVMWDVLSGDFDTNLSLSKCVNNVVTNASAGSIIVFHDSAKAFERLSFALPTVLKYYTELGYQFRVLPD